MRADEYKGRTTLSCDVCGETIGTLETGWYMASTPVSADLIRGFRTEHGVRNLRLAKVELTTVCAECYRLLHDHIYGDDAPDDAPIEGGEQEVPY